MNRNNVSNREYYRLLMRITLVLAMVTIISMAPASTFAQGEGEVAAEAEAQDILPEATGVTARLSTEQSDLTVGDAATLTLEVTHPAGYQIFAPELDGPWGEFEVLDQSLWSTEVNADGTETTRQTLDATLFAPGEYWTPLLSLTLSDPRGNLSQVLVESIPLQVVSVLTEQDTEIRDIKPQASLPIPTTWPMIGAGALLLLLLVVGAAWWVVRKVRNRPTLDRRSPAEVAFDDLERIRGLRLPEQGKYKEQYGQVTTCLWTYIEAQYGVQVTDETTSEIRVTLRSTPMSETHAVSFINLFTDCDLVKFAEFNPSTAVADQLISESRQLVEACAAEAVQQAIDENNRAGGANPPSATTTIATTVAGA